MDNQNLPTTKNTFGANLELCTLSDAYQFAGMVLSGGFAPKGATVESVVISMQMGAEIGLKPMASIQNIAVINGRPSIWGDASIAVVQQHPLFEGIEEIQIGEKGTDSFGYRCTIKRNGMTPHVVEFTVADAKNAGLFGKVGPWKNYMPRMLQMRARGFAMRDRFSDSLKGMILREEAMDMPVEKNITPQASHSDTESKPSVLDRKKKTEVVEAEVVEISMHEKVIEALKPLTVEEIKNCFDGLAKSDSSRSAFDDMTDEILADILKDSEGWKTYIQSQKQIPVQPQKINAEQLKRLQTIRGGSNKTDAELKVYLLECYGLKSSKSVTVDIYEAVCEWIQNGVAKVSEPQAQEPDGGLF